jgi:hypothetical protein
LGAGNTHRRYRIPKGTIGGQLARRGWGRLAPWLDKSLAPALLDCTREQFQRLLYGLWLGDGLKDAGNTRPRSAVAFCSHDPVLLDRVQAWAVQRGFAANQAWHPNTSGGRYPDSTMGYLRIRDRRTVRTNNHTVPTSGGNPAQFEEGWQAETVWCVTNPNGTIVTRRNGKVAVMGQCGVLTEGFDEPSIACVLIARPTRSRVLFTQMVGRGTRLHPGKDDCLVLDLAGVTERHDLATVAELAGLDPAELEGKTVTEALAARQARDEEERAGGDGGGEEKLRLPGITVTVPMFRSKMRWLQVAGEYVLPCDNGAAVHLVGAGDTWRVEGRRRGREPKVLAEGLSLEYAQGFGEDIARRFRGGAPASADASWRTKPPSARQLAALKKWRIKVPKARLAGLTAGDVSDLINTAAAKAAAEKAGPR